MALAALAPSVLPKGCRIVPMPCRAPRPSGCSAKRDERSLREDGVSQADGPQWDEAEAQLAHSLRLLKEGHSRLEAARTRVAWACARVTVSRCDGRMASFGCSAKRCQMFWGH